MNKIIIIVLLCVSNQLYAIKVSSGDTVVGDYGLHFSQQGRVIAPDEYYIFHAVKNEKEGYKKIARKHFQKAASYGNTFGIFYTGLLYLQEDENLKVMLGFHWLILTAFLMPAE